MAKTSDKPAGPPKADKTGAPTGSMSGSMSGFLAEENDFDRSSLLRIGTWGAIAVGAVVLAVISNQSSLGWHREQLAATDLARQAQQIQQLTKESQNETRRLASAIDTLNNDRDRLYSRVTVLEQGLDSVTGTIAKQNAPPSAAAAPTPIPAEPPATPPAAAPPAAPAPQVKAQGAPPAKQPGPPPNQQANSPASQSPPAVMPVASAPAPRALEPDKPRADMMAKSDPAAPVASPAQFASNASALVAASEPPPLIQPKSMMGPPDPAASKLIEAPKPVAAPEQTGQAGLQAVAAAAPPKDQSAPDAAPNASPDEVTIHHTEFAVDLGSANSVGGLRALWRGLVKSNTELAELHPIIVVKEGTTGLGMQLRLAAGPLHDAAAAAKICAALTESKRACETTVFDGQRLAMAADEAHAGEKPAGEVRPAPTTYRHGYYPKRAKREDPPPAPQSSTLSSLLGVGKR